MIVIEFFISAKSLASWSTFIAYISMIYSSFFELTKKRASFFSLITPCPIKVKKFNEYLLSFAFLSKNVYLNTGTLPILNVDLGQTRFYEGRNNSNSQVVKTLGFLTPTQINSGNFVITGTNATGNTITLNTTSGLYVGQVVIISGTVFGGLTVGTYTIAGIVGSTITLNASPTLTTASGLMSLSLQNVNILQSCTTSNPPVFFDRITTNRITVNIVDENGTAWVDSNGQDISSYVLILNFRCI
jgi:hypothetical protein